MLSGGKKNRKSKDNMRRMVTVDSISREGGKTTFALEF